MGANVILHRVHRTRNAPLFFDATGENRFDDPRREFGVLYASESAACAFIETFAEPLDFPFVTVAQLAARKLSLLIGESLRDQRPRTVDASCPNRNRRASSVTTGPVENSFPRA